MLALFLIVCIVLQIICIIEMEKCMDKVEKALKDYAVIYYETRELHQKMKTMLDNKQEVKHT